MRVKNNKGSSDVWSGQTIASSAEYDIQSVELANWRSSDKVITDLSTGDLLIGDGVTYKTAGATAVGYLLGTSNDVSVKEQVPFAKPDYRTKRSKTAGITTVAPNTTENIDFQLTAERYVSGGAIIFKAAEIGDYVTASVYDKDSVVPEAYRAALCEAWPVVAEYIVGEWIPNGDGRYTIDTYPLNAKVTAGLYLRVSYTAANVGSDRKIGVNYFLTKKL